MTNTHLQRRMNERIDIADNTGDTRDQDHGEASDDLESWTMSEVSAIPIISFHSTVKCISILLFFE